jgi:hypothetical protein
MLYDPEFREWRLFGAKILSLSVFKETDKIEMIADRFAAAEGRGAPLAEGLGADLAMTKICELRKVQDISSFLLHARI